MAQNNETDTFMEAAIAEARLGASEGGVPIGSVLVKGGNAIASGRNRRVQELNPVLHAEIDCLQRAGRIQKYVGCVLYSTLMPCYMCAGAVIQFGIKKVVAGESATFPGAKSLMVEHGVEVIDLDLESCKELMRDFIRRRPDVWQEDIGTL